MSQANPSAPTFASVPMGLPGLETRLPLLFSAGVFEERIDLLTFAAVTATNPAKLYGLHPRKGCIALGADADLALFDPAAAPWVMAHSELHDVLDYTPYEGLRMAGGRLTHTVLRGEVVYVAATQELLARRGGGRWVATGQPSLLGCAWEGEFPSQVDVVLDKASRL